jgi:uncharacterized protein YehS (DUF1456 family)
MTNNDVLRRIRYTFDLSDSKMIDIFSLAGVIVDRSLISQWLKKDEDPDFVLCEDVSLAAFLNGFIILKRGRKDDSEVVNESKLSNNIILNKVKIALSLQSSEVLELLDSVDMPVSKHELSAFFRKAGHKNYRTCNDQLFRRFLQSIQTKYRPADEPFSWT